MKALVFSGAWQRLASAKLLGSIRATGYMHRLGPLRLLDVPAPELPGPEWVRIQTRRSGICGSDLKQIFLEGSLDNPLTSFITFPHIMGHEVAGEVVDAGSAVTMVNIGDRVAVHPWLTCVPRGLARCAGCEDGSTCDNLHAGDFAAGMHLGTCRDVGGGFAEQLVVHESMCFVLPPAVDWDAAALADPFAVCLHALLQSPPHAGERVLVVGCGALGMMLINLIEELYPGVVVWATDRTPRLAALAQKLGAEEYFPLSGTELIEAIGGKLGAKVHKPWRGQPWLMQGVDRVYDMVGSAATIEVGLRILEPRGQLVVVGVSQPERFEWTPLYFKELHIVGSNGYGIEDFEGERHHAMDVFLDLVASRRLDPAPFITHHFPLGRYRHAFGAARNKHASGAIKVAFSLP